MTTKPFLYIFCFYLFVFFFLYWPIHIPKKKPLCAPFCIIYPTCPQNQTKKKPNQTKNNENQKWNKTKSICNVMCRGQPIALSWRRLNTIAPLPNIVDAWNHTHNNNLSNSNDIHNHLWTEPNQTELNVINFLPNERKTTDKLFLGKWSDHSQRNYRLTSLLNALFLVITYIHTHAKPTNLKHFHFLLEMKL